MIKNQERPDKFQLCTERGIEPSEPGYDRLLRYASAGEWLTSQFERKTGMMVSSYGYGVMASTNLLMAHFDDSTDTGECPDWHRTYKQAIFPDITSDKLVIPKFGPQKLIDRTHQDLSALPSRHLERISSSWNQLVLSMFDHKCAVMGEKVSVSGIVATRVAEAISLADLYTSIMMGEIDDYLYTSFYDWLSVQLSAGNLIDTIADQKEDQLNGHTPLSYRDRAYLTGVAGVYAIRYINHPMTQREDLTFMFKKFIKHYMSPKLRASSSSQPAR